MRNLLLLLYAWYKCDAQNGNACNGIWSYPTGSSYGISFWPTHYYRHP